jgi:hypothetical protein
MADLPTPARRWLSFSNSDQKILREDSRGRLWDALVVPGTLATYYKQGVGGYVLATRQPFVIDPRTPLIQPTSPRAIPRASHKTLAKIHDEAVGTQWEQGQEVQMEVWTAERWKSTVRRVLEFQTSFQSAAAEKISKYEKMLEGSGMTLDIPVHGPERLIPPYWAVRGAQDQWWNLSLSAIEQAIDEHGPRSVMPVICLGAETPTQTFADLIRALPEGVDRVFCWRGAWDEAKATSEDIAGWLSTIDAAAMAQIEVTNMYGGALSILLTGCGLAGVNHGVGYSESRNEQRLGSTGAPPMRYYVPRLRQFLPVPQAQQALDLLAEPGDSWACQCEICRDLTTIVDLKTEQLKEHFLLCRASEFKAAAEDLSEAVYEVRADGQRLIQRFGSDDDEDDKVVGNLAHRGKVLVGWSVALEGNAGPWPTSPHY